jgi:hypothetical protein
MPRVVNLPTRVSGQQHDRDGLLPAPSDRLQHLAKRHSVPSRLRFLPAHTVSARRPARPVAPTGRAVAVAAAAQGPFIALTVTGTNRRSESGWNQGHIPGAVHIPEPQLSARIAEVAPDLAAEVVVYCWGPAATAARGRR